VLVRENGAVTRAHAGCPIQSANTQATAAWRRVHASACRDSHLYLPSAGGPVGIKLPGTLYNADSGSARKVVCPVRQDDELKVDQVTNVTVAMHGVLYNDLRPFDASLQTCVTFDDGTGGACGPFTIVSGSGDRQVNVSPGPWSQTGFGETFFMDYASLWIILPQAREPGGAILLRGYWEVRGYTMGT
jgi:hypothetical protein